MNRALRDRLMAINTAVGKQLGFKLRKVPYSRPATLKAREIFGDTPIRVIEIGCARGHNAVDILQSLNVSEYVVVDPYERAYSSYGDYGREKLIAMREQAHKNLARHADRIVWIQELSDAAVAKIVGKADYIYVDGDHSYDAALADMRNYYGLLNDRFVFAGHDIDNPGVAKAFVQFASERDLESYAIVDPDWIVFRG